MTQSEELLDAPNGSALTWILDHCLRYPGTYEIPLRSMYSLNCNSMRQQGAHPPDSSFTPQSSHSSKSSQSSHEFHLDPAADFKAQLTHQISRSPSQPCTLPPSFLTSFLRRCFAPPFEEVDVHQALTALDYLRGLETRRRQDLTAALQRLRLKPEDLGDPELGKKRPCIATWVESMNTKAQKALSLYNNVYIGLRRWTLISEMLSEPYNKANCIAMLNTLFPPVTEFTTTATPQLSPHVLKSQRDGFFRYISAVDANGKQILDQVIQHGAQPGEKNAWSLVRDTLDKYLRTANEIIDECHGVDLSTLEEESRRKGRKVDSGVSFAASINSSGGNSNECNLDKPLPPAPADDVQEKSGGSTLERLARELRKMKIGESGKSKGLRSMRSSSSLAVRGDNLYTHSSESSFFDIDDQKRKRLIWEARSRKKSHSKQSSTDS